MDKKKALTVLYDCAEQELDRGHPGGWPELEEALRVVEPETEYGPKRKRKVSSDAEFIRSLLPPWAKTVPEGLDPTMYGTLSAEGDRGVKERVDRILSKLEERA